MRYDDRLRTVLDSVAETSRDRAIRWRQIVELLARGAACADEPLFEEALSTAVSESGHVDDEVRMATARAIAPAQLPVRLISAIARDRLNVAAPVLAGARLTALEWGDVLATASSECRAFVHSLRSEEASSPQAPTAEPVTATAKPGESQLRPRLRVDVSVSGRQLRRCHTVPESSVIVSLSGS